jgi:hypothetical protein
MRTSPNSGFMQMPMLWQALQRQYRSVDVKPLPPPLEECGAYALGCE